MKIIDAHMHYHAVDHFDIIAKAAGHENTDACWQQICRDNNIVFAVAMGNSYDAPSRFGGTPPRLINLKAPYTLEPAYNQAANVGYCLGVMSEEMTEENADKTAQEFEYYLQRDKHCLGIKFYMGYNRVYLNDKRHQPLFELAQAYNVPVAMHSGETAGHHGQLKYAHPLTVDEAASEHPEVKFVICHLGNPWVMDAAAVASKCENVYLDASGLFEGRITPQALIDGAEYFRYLRMWLSYLGNWDKVMYGSDWPLINIPENIKVLGDIVPERYHEQFFYKNALTVYSKIQDCLAL